MQQPSDTAQFVASIPQSYIQKQAQQLANVSARAPLTTLSMVPTPQQLGVISNGGNSLGGSAPVVGNPPPVSVPISNTGNRTIAAISPVVSVAPIAGGVKPPAPVSTTSPLATPKRTPITSGLSNPAQQTAPAPATTTVTAATPARVTANVPSSPVAGLSNPANTVLSPSAVLPRPTANVPSHNAGGGFAPVVYNAPQNEPPTEIHPTE